MPALLKALLIIRPHNVAAAVLCVAAGYALGGGGAPWPLLLLSATAVATAAGNVINDWFDRDIDAINKPGRPLPSGAVTGSAAIGLYLLLLALLAVCAALLPPAQGGWIVVWAILLHWYSRTLKRRYLAGNLLVSAVAASGFALGALAAGDSRRGALPALFTFVFVLGRELVKDAEDVRGDRACGARTVPVVSGADRTLVASALIFTVLAAAFPVPYCTGTYGKGYLAAVSGTVIPILAVSAALCFARRAPRAVSILLKLGMFFGVAAFWLGSGRSAG
ncbi:MAG: geranylgeranylglycerol-phosphate geranylgeranyltransferase [Candidatus Krumholzibacteria bacterium]|nr:geranylgeranylglycerol-phosphate geranylgeranyltransferase [Candidatus Krumholzibacteria bacterium]